MLDHYSAAAVAAHLAAVGDRLLDAVPAELVGSVFCDSLEVYGADWTPRCRRSSPAGAATRSSRCCYRLAVDRAPAPHGCARTTIARWPSCTRRTSSRSASAGRRVAGCRSGSRATARRRRRSAATGSPTCSRARAGAGRRSRRADGPPPPATSTAATWCRRRSGPGCTRRPSGPPRSTSRARRTSTCSAGSTSSIGHGWPYSPSDAPGLGWFFYAAGAIDDRNPWWPAMPELNAYLGRLCWLLRQGEPVADVAVYVPNEDLFAAMGRAVGGSLDTWREANRRIPGEIPATIRTRRAGLRPDRRRRRSRSPRRTATEWWSCRRRRCSRTATAAWLQAVQRGRRHGDHDRLRRCEVPVPSSVEPTELAAALTAAVAPDLEVTPQPPDIGFVHRRHAAMRHLPAGQHRSEPPGVPRRQPGRAPRYQEWDASTGRVRRSGETG